MLQGCWAVFWAVDSNVTEMATVVNGRDVMKKVFRCVVLSTAVAMAAQAQTADQIRRATIAGSGGTSGKCTVEVRVDGSAEVDIYGDSGRLRTVAGQPAAWTRMECSDALPAAMSDFRFRGIDGRGSVKLAQDPRNNNGMAVVRIDDTKGGSEGYTFSIEWSGASAAAPTGGFQNNQYELTPSATGRRGTDRFGRGGTGNVSTERAIDLCRNEVRTKGERDYGLRNIDITAAGVDTNSGRRDWVVGTFNDRSGSRRRGNNTYRFNCSVDYNSGQIRAVEILRADGSSVQGASAPYNASTPQEQSGYNQQQLFRVCQDAVVARTARDGYQNVSFSSTAVDNRRADWVSGALTASRGPVTDTFDFGCSMDFGSARVRNVEVTRR